MSVPSPRRLPHHAALLAILLVIAACGGAAAPAGTTPPVEGATPTPTPTPLGGGGGGSEPSGDPGGPGESADPDEGTGEEGGEGTRRQVDLLAGDWLWDGTVDWSGMGNWDHWTVNVDVVIRRSTSTRGLVFAKGSTFTADWERNPIGDGCPDKGSWTGDVSTPSGEGIDSMSDQSPEALGIVWEGEEDLRLDVLLFDRPVEDACSYPGTKLSCPLEGVTGNPYPLWEAIALEPVELHMSCTDTSTATNSARYTVNTRGILEEARDVPPEE